jgi:hypothetical protein
VPILETKSPGVFGFERTPSRAPEGLSPAKAAFVGWTDEGLSNTPVEVRSFEESVGQRHHDPHSRQQELPRPHGRR